MKDSDAKPREEAKSDSTRGDDEDQGGINRKSSHGLQVSNPIASYLIEEDDSSLQVAEERQVPLDSLVFSPRLFIDTCRHDIERATRNLYLNRKCRALLSNFYAYLFTTVLQHERVTSKTC